MIHGLYLLRNITYKFGTNITLKILFSPLVKEYLHQKYNIPFQNIFASNRPSYDTKIYLLSINIFSAQNIFETNLLYF